LPYPGDGRGSRFILRVPVRVLDEGTLAQEARDAPPPPLIGLQVLLVDDHVLNRRVIAAQLQQLGADVREADGPAAALAQQAASPASVVLLDIELDAMDGYTLATQLRAQELDLANRACLLALSGHSGDEYLQRCQRAGFDGLLVKPLQIEPLLKALDLGGTDSLFATHRLQGVLQMRGVAAMRDVAGELWSMGNAAAPHWPEAQRLVRVLRLWRGDLPAAPES